MLTDIFAAVLIAVSVIIGAIAVWQLRSISKTGKETLLGKWIRKNIRFKGEKNVKRDFVIVVFLVAVLTAIFDQVFGSYAIYNGLEKLDTKFTKRRGKSMMKV